MDIECGFVGEEDGTGVFARSLEVHHLGTLAKRKERNQQRT
jgi:hypothetical protein